MFATTLVMETHLTAVDCVVLEPLEPVFAGDSEPATFSNAMQSVVCKFEFC